VAGTLRAYPPCENQVRQNDLDDGQGDWRQRDELLSAPTRAIDTEQLMGAKLAPRFRGCLRTKMDGPISFLSRWSARGEMHSRRRTCC
jgi:hypothetical protein